MPSAYIETTVPSLYTSYPSKRLVEAARQNITNEWWDTKRQEFDLYCSQSVITECAQGDTEMAKLRVELLEGIPLLDIHDGVVEIAHEILKRQIIPEKAAEDAIHIAVASAYEIDYLVTWNCKHIANPRNWRRISDCLASFDIRASVICTPEDLLENLDG